MSCEQESSRVAHLAARKFLRRSKKKNIFNSLLLEVLVSLDCGLFIYCWCESMKNAKNGKLITCQRNWWKVGSLNMHGKPREKRMICISAFAASQNGNESKSIIIIGSSNKHTKLRNIRKENIFSSWGNPLKNVSFESKGSAFANFKLHEKCIIIIIFL